MKIIQRVEGSQINQNQELFTFHQTQNFSVKSFLYKSLSIVERNSKAY